MEPTSRVTLKALASFAAALFRLRAIFVIVGLGAGIWFGFALANPETTSEIAFLPLVLLLWMVLMLGIAYTLPRLPTPIAPGDGFRLKIRKRLAKVGYSLAIVTTVGLGGFALFLSLRALRLAI